MVGQAIRCLRPAILVSEANYLADLMTATASHDNLTRSAARLRLAITRTARRLRQEASGELTPTSAATLATVERHGPLTPSEVAEIERIRRPSATRSLRALEDAALVRRTADPA